MITRAKNYLNSQIALIHLQRSVWFDTQKLMVLQENRLKSIINNAYENVPYYNTLFHSAGIAPKDIKNLADLKKIPITTKDTLRTLSTSIYSRKHDLTKCSTHRTSGSTGIPLDIVYDREAGAYSYAGYERARRENGYRPSKDILLNFSTTDSNHSGRKRWPSSRRYSLSVSRSVDDQIRIMKMINPTVLWGYPSALQLIAQQYEQKETDNAVRLIFTASEINSPELKKYLASIFNASVLDVYGSWETGCIAWECCKHEGYHVAMENVVVEIVDDRGEPVGPGEKGRVIVTNLNSNAMPFIRYELGDFAIPIEEECSCGRGGSMIRQIEGRYDDFIKLPSGITLSPRSLSSPIRLMSEILEFQIVQEKLDLIKVYIKVDGNADQKHLESIITNDLSQIVGNNTQIEVKFVDTISRTSSGKLRSVISRIN